MQYNTSREKLLMPEYGRHIQDMVNYVKTIKDPEKQKKNAEAVVNLMKGLNFHVNSVEDFNHMLWDHLYVISNFELDIKDAPYPKPTPEELTKKPERLNYPQRTKERRHLGAHLNTLIDLAIEEKNPDTKRALINSIAYYMKLSYAGWHHEVVSDGMIKDELAHISNGALNYIEGDVDVAIDSHLLNRGRHNGGGKPSKRNGRKNNGYHKNGGRKMKRK